MEIEIRNPQINPLNLAREIGYTTTQYSQGTEVNFVRRIGRNPYPRFHIYLKKKGEDFIINLHLDQKKTSYHGSSAHSAEYDSDVIQREMERIKGVLGL